METLAKWFEFVHEQVKGPVEGQVFDVDDFVKLRVWSVGDRPCYALTE